MRPDDARHGTHAGYVAGCRCDPCRVARLRAAKERDLHRYRHGSCMVDHARQATVVEPWLQQGVTLHALCDAAGFGSRTDYVSIYARKSVIRRDTFRALARVTEDDLLETACINADLTRARIYSLMAAGHQLKDMPILKTGAWRARARVSVAQARAIRDHFRALEMVPGGHASTAARARNSGHLPPLAWDDPGTLAWPPRVTSFVAAEPDEVQEQDIDPVVIARILHGEAVAATQAERFEVVARWPETGRPVNDLARLTGWKPERYTTDSQEISA